MGKAANVISKATDLTSIGTISKYSSKKEQKKKDQAAMQAMAATQTEKQAELEQRNKGLAKELDIATRDKKKQGISSLVGSSDSDTLG